MLKATVCRRKAAKCHRVIVVLAVEKVRSGDHELVVPVAVDVGNAGCAQDMGVDVHLPCSNALASRI